MANFDQLKQSVAALIRTNGAEEITGQIMQDVLLTIINSISGGYMFGGVAQHNGNVGNPDYNVFYLAGSGAYTGYGGAITIEAGCYGVFRYNGVWTQEVVDIGVRLSGSIAPGETRGVTGDVINTALQTLFDNVMDILDTLTFTYNTPSAQQATKAMLDVIMTPTGGAPHVFATLTLASATVAAAGLMSAEDKQKVDRMLTDFRSLSLTDTTAAADQATKIVQTLSATLGENPEAITTFTLLAATVSKAGLMSADDKVTLDKLVAMLGYYVCDTAAGTAAKTISATGYTLTNGGCIRIKMTNANTAANATLNINSTGAKALYYDGAQASSTNTWEAGEVMEVYYDGMQYQCAYSREKKTINAVNRALIPVSGNVSIIGDSISTFAGTMPNGYAAYYPNASLGVTNLYDMWWQHILSLTSSKIGVNASWSGSRATKTAGSSVPDFYERANILGNPDYIFVELGVNDSYYNVALGDYDYESETLSETQFIPAYTKGVKALLSNYPSAKIVLFIFQMADQYAAAIENIGTHYGLPVIDVRSYYTDNLHPSKDGMKTVAQSIVSYYVSQNGGGGKFATGEMVKEVGITNVLDDSHNLIESSAVNAVLNDAINFSEWVIGSLKDNHTYDDVQGRIEACAVINGRVLNYTIASGYAMSIHEYSEEFHTIDTIIGSSWIKYTTSWIQGSGTFTPTAGTKTIVVILSKTPTSSMLNILPSEASNLTIAFTNPFTLSEMREMLGEHDQAIDMLEEAVMIEGEVSTSWYQGTLSNAHIYYSTGDVTPQRIIATVPAQKKLTFTIASGYSIAVHEYSAAYSNPTEITNGNSWLNTLGTWNEGTLEYIPTAACKTVVLIMRKGNGSSNILPSEGGNLTGTFISPVKYTVEELQENVDGIHDTLEGVDSGGGVYVPAWYQGTLGDANHDYDSTSSYAPKRIICTVPLTPLLKVTVTSGYWASVHEYSEVYANATQITGGSAWLGNTHGWFDGSMDITPLAATKTFVIVMSKGNKNVNISPSEGVNTTVTTDSIHVEGLIEKVEELAYDDSDSYYWGADMIKRKCRTTQLGTLTYLQAFCKYNGKYYSTDGSNIAEQDESFAVLRNVAISVGHGNSLQLVSNGKAWASGWDDQKMYRVDLATLTVDQTITLPTTGYTTCAVDEDNGWMYIFQRQTNPSTEAQYNFIKYDYVNEQIISTRKIETFAAMQAVDYWQGKILMLNGFGTQAAPSGMRIYNTNGDVLVTYDLQVFRAKEPEGIIFTRDKGELLVSDVDRKLYIVS